MNEKIIILLYFFGGILLDYFLAFVINGYSKKGRIPIRLYISNFRFHHSSLGLLLVLIGLFFDFYSLILISLGIGIMLGHTIRARKLIFFERR